MKHHFFFSAFTLFNSNFELTEADTKKPLFVIFSYILHYIKTYVDMLYKQLFVTLLVLYFVS